MSHAHYRSQSVPAIEVDENFKRSLRKRVEYKLTGRFYEAQKNRDAALSAAGDDENERARAARTYETTIDHLKVVAEEEYQGLLRREIAARAGGERREQQPVESVEQQQQRILDSIQRGGDDHITYPMRAPSAQGGREHGVRRPSFSTAPHPEIWRPPTGASAEPSGIARTFAHAHAASARPPTAPPAMRRGSASGGPSGQGISTASEHARAAGRYTPTPTPGSASASVQQAQAQEHWTRRRAPSDALGRQSPALSRAGVATPQRWEVPRTAAAARPIVRTHGGAHDLGMSMGNGGLPASSSPSRAHAYGSPSSPGDVPARQGIAIPRASRFASEDTSRSASFGSSSLRKESSTRWGGLRGGVVRESPESDEGEGDEDGDEDGDDVDETDFAHGIELGQSPEDRRRAEERDRLLAVKLQREEMRAAEEERRRRRTEEDQQEEFRRREGQYYRRAVERERQNSIDAGRSAATASPSSWGGVGRRGSPGPGTNGVGVNGANGTGRDELRKALLEQEVFPTAGPSRPRQSHENAVAGPSGSGSSGSGSGSSRAGKANAEAADRRVSSMRTRAEEALEELLVEAADLRDRRLADAGDDDGARAEAMGAYAGAMEGVHAILDDFHGRLQRELRERRTEIAAVMGRAQNGAGIHIR